MIAALKGAAARRVFLCFACAYFLSYALRSINAVIAPALLRELGLSNADLGLLSSAYFVSFAALQLPLGVWLDKYGPRRTEAALLLCAAAGAAVFATSSSLLGLWVGRALIGAGVSACLMAAFKAYRQWFSIDRQSLLASWMLVAGTAGALSATVPVTAALPLIGWRGIFWIFSVLILAAAAAIYFLLADTERRFACATGATATAVRPAHDGGYGQIFSSPYFRRMGLIGMVNQGIFIALQTLWAGPWMTTVLGMSAQETGRILFVFNFALMLSYLALAWWAPRLIARAGWGLHRVIGTGLGATLVVQAAMLLLVAPWAWILWLPLALCVTVTTLVQTHAGLAFPAALAGRANAAYNLMLFIGAFGAQWGIGLVADSFKLHGASASGALRAAFAICLLLQAAALASFLFNRAQAPHAELRTADE
jgi:predicted MFS family arabinose efflux permease